MNNEEFLEILKSRRSIRKFMPDPVPAADVEKIITAASWAPSGTNKQNWSFVVVTTAEIKKAMKEAVEAELAAVSEKINLSDARNVFKTYSLNFTFFNEAPVVIAVIKKPYNSITQKILNRYKIYRPEPSTDVQGPSAAIQNLMLMAHVLGYGTCWMTGPLIARERLEKLLGVSSPDELMAVIPLGRPAHAPDHPPKKHLPDITRHM
jgi:nitroreductase